MKNHPLLALLLTLTPMVALVAAEPSPTPTQETVKKGAAGGGKGGVENLLRDSGVSWNYNWHPETGMVMPTGVEFVPMIWGKRDIPSIGKLSGEGRPLLGFNEPDRKDQGNMTVEEALAEWPKLEATKMRLGSPAPAGGGARPGGWLDLFMSGCKEKGYRVDFICLHWYGPNYDPEVATKQLNAYLTAVHDRYGKPIWLTEFALRNFKGDIATMAQQQAFMAKVLPMLDELPFVERYSWFVFGAMNPKKPPNSWYLLSPEQKLSELGSTYATTGKSVRK